MKDNTIDYERIVDQLVDADFDGFIATEYVWIEWERANECDNVSETVMMRDRIRDRLAGREWQYAGATTLQSGKRPYESCECSRSPVTT